MDTELREKIQQWRRQALPLIDLRTSSAYAAAHLRGSTHIPLTELRLRRHELPDRGAQLCLLHDADMSDAQALLRDWGYELSAVMSVQELDWLELQALDETESGSNSRQWWRACSLLEQHIITIEKNVGQRCALDVACGSGRDSLFLAQRGWQITAVDNQPDALQRLRLSAERLHVSVDTLCQNIERDVPTFAHEAFDLILVVRYLHRPLLPLLGQWLKRGGYLLYQQFHADAAAYGKPRNPGHLLRGGELRAMYPTMEILQDDIEHLPDGRPMVNFLARKI